MATNTGVQRDGPTETSDEQTTDRGPFALLALAGAIAAAVVSPLLWVLLAATGVGADALALLTQARTVEVFLNSTLMVVAVTGLSILLAVPLAFLTTRTDLPFRRFWTVAVSLPLVVPSYIGAFAFVSAFGPQGELQSVLAPLGVTSLPELYGFPGVVGILTLYTYPYVFLSTRAALKTMDSRLTDAARTLGDSRWRAFRRVTLPQIRPAIAAGALLVALYALSDFGTPAIMRFDAFTRVIYVELNAFGRDLAAVLSLQLVAVTLFILALESRVRGHAPAGGGAHHSTTVHLGRWRWPAIALPAGVTLLGLAIPIGILLMWLVRSSSSIGGFGFEYVLNSLAVAGAAALVAAVCCLPVAYLAAYHRSRLSALFERATYVGYAVPGVVLGLALVFFGSRYFGGLYQTLPLLVFAYVVRFLPQAVGTTRASFLRVDRQLPGAARTLGDGSIRAFRRVTLPLVAPGLLAGAALVFLTTMKELPATLMLRPTGFETLVTRVWQAESAGYFGQAAVPALILVFVSGLSMLVLLSREGYDGR